jgi:hypothetical protein
VSLSKVIDKGDLMRSVTQLLETRFTLKYSQCSFAEIIFFKLGRSLSIAMAGAVAVGDSTGPI